MKVGVLFSGGKDSTYAAYIAKKQGYELGCLISMISKNKESFMFHTPSISMVKEQAKAMGIPLISGITKGKKEEELKDLEKTIKQAVKAHKIEGVVTGAVQSVYQSSRIQKICNKLGIECFNPLWQKDPKIYWEEMLNLKFKIIIAGISSEGIGKNWLGKEINHEDLQELKRLSKKYSFHLGFEGGEAETFVIDCPLFQKKLEIVSASKTWKETNGVYEIKEIKLLTKEV